MVTIYLTGAMEGKSINIMKKYPFRDGKLTIKDDDDGATIFRFLKKYYPVATKEPVKPAPKPKVSSTVPTSNQQV